MRPILAALLTAALTVPSTAFACGMPMRVAEVEVEAAAITLADVLDAIDEADEKKAADTKAKPKADAEAPPADAPQPAPPAPPKS